MSKKQAKRQKLGQIEEPNQSWILKEPLIQDLIFQHLRGQDVKNLFLVSTSWNHAAATSRVAMSKVSLTLVETRDNVLKRKIADKLISSIRRYNNAVISVRYGPSIPRVCAVLKSHQTSLDEIRLYPQEDCNLELPPCAELQKVRKVVIYLLKPEPFASFITGLENLTELEIGCNAIVNLTPLPALSNRLTSFSFESYWGSYLNLHVAGNFLLSISSTLETLNIKNCSQDLFEFILDQLPKLTTFKVDEFAFVPRPGLIKNQTIREFDFCSSYARDLPAIPRDFMENLKIVKTDFIKPQHLKTLLENCGSVKKIHVISCHYNLKNMYQRLIEADPNIPKDIEFVHKCIGMYYCMFE